MGTFDEFLINNDKVEVSIPGAGKCQGRIDGKLIADETYVSGDMEDKLMAALRIYKKILIKLTGDDDNAE